MLLDQLRLVGSPQTNKVMHAEMIRVAVRALGRRPPEPKKEGTGSLVYPFDPGLAGAALVYLRTPTRVVWDLFRVETDRLEPLYDALRADVAGDARAWAPPAGAGISVEVRRVGAFAAGERQIVGTVKNALIDGAAARGIALRLEPDVPELLFVARMDDAGGLVVSLDLGGGSLSQRGWRIDHGDAPLREHLAAVLLMLGRFDPRVDVLVDPMCGSGTIPIEAALMSRGAPRRIDPPVPALAGEGVWPKGLALFADAAPIIVGNDLDLEALVAARKNAARAFAPGANARDLVTRGAQVDGVTWRRGDFRGLTPGEIAAIAAERGRASTHGLVLANPPYGERLDTVDLRLLYGELADWVRGLGAGWRAGFLVDNLDFEPTFERAFRARARIKKPLANGPLRAYFYLYE